MLWLRESKWIQPLRVNIFNTSQIPINRFELDVDKYIHVFLKIFNQSSKRKASGNTDKKISTGTLNAIFENLMQVSLYFIKVKPDLT